jgi:hypothetical protein
MLLQMVSLSPSSQALLGTASHAASSHATGIDGLKQYFEFAGFVPQSLLQEYAVPARTSDPVLTSREVNPSSRFQVLSNGGHEDGSALEGGVIAPNGAISFPRR